MASCSRTFLKPLSAEEERNLIENAIPKSTRAVTKWSVKILLEWQSGGKNKNRAPSQLKSLKCNGWTLI